MTSRIEFLDAEFTDLESPRDARTHTRLEGDVLFGSQPERPAAVNAKSTSSVTSVRPNAPFNARLYWSRVPSSMLFRLAR